MSRTILMKFAKDGQVLLMRKPSGDPALCEACGYPLGSRDEDGCKSCGADLCSDCFRHEPYCHLCPSDSEERPAGWWEALMETGGSEP